MPKGLVLLWIALLHVNDVFGEAGQAVQRECLTTDDEILNVRFYELRQQIDQVGAQVHWDSARFMGSPRKALTVWALGYRGSSGKSRPERLRTWKMIDAELAQELFAR